MKEKLCLQCYLHHIFLSKIGRTITYDTDFNELFIYIYFYSSQLMIARSMHLLNTQGFYLDTLEVIITRHSYHCIHI
jgi:hypothetical protein